MNNLFDFSGRYLEDLTLIRLAKTALPEDDARIVDLLQIETTLATHLGRAEQVQQENITIAKVNEMIESEIAKFESIAGVSFDHSKYIVQDPPITPEIENQLSTLSNVRNLLASLLSTADFKGREVRRLVGIIVKGSIALYRELVKNGNALPTIEDGKKTKKNPEDGETQENKKLSVAEQMLEVAWERFIADAQGLINDNDAWAIVADMFVGRDPAESLFSHEDNRSRLILTKYKEAKAKGAAIDWPQLIRDVDAELPDFNKAWHEDPIARETFKRNWGLYGQLTEPDAA